MFFGYLDTKKHQKTTMFMLNLLLINYAYFPLGPCTLIVML